MANYGLAVEVVRVEVDQDVAGGGIGNDFPDPADGLEFPGEFPGPAGGTLHLRHFDAETAIKNVQVGRSTHCRRFLSGRIFFFL
jgi:hypothetical protein